MPTNIEMVLEGERRGILPQHVSDRLSEARRRGLVPPLEAQTPQEEQGLFGRVGEDLSARGEAIGALSRGEYGQGDLKLPVPLRASPILGQAIAGGASAIYDVAGEALSSYASAITPDWIEDPVKKALGIGGKEVGGAILESDVGKLGIEALQKGVEYWEEFQKNYPAAAVQMGGAANILALGVPGAKAVKSVTPIVKEVVGVVAPVVGEIAKVVVREVVVEPSRAVVKKLLKINPSAVREFQDAAIRYTGKALVNTSVLKITNSTCIFF